MDLIEFLDTKEAEKSLDPGLVKAFGDNIIVFKAMTDYHIKELTKFVNSWDIATDGRTKICYFAITTAKKTPEQETTKYADDLLAARKMVLNDALKPLAKYNPKIFIHFSTMAPGTQAWRMTLHK